MPVKTVTIGLLRHARAAHGDTPDMHRPLTPKGRKDVTRVARQAVRLGFKPDLILCSSSRRTRITAERFRKELALETDIVSLNSLYLGSPETLRKEMETAVLGGFRSILPLNKLRKALVKICLSCTCIGVAEMYNRLCAEETDVSFASQPASAGECVDLSPSRPEN